MNKSTLFFAAHFKVNLYDAKKNQKTKDAIYHPL